MQSIPQLKHMDLMITKHDKTEEDTIQVTIWQVHSTKITESYKSVKIDAIFMYMP